MPQPRVERYVSKPVIKLDVMTGEGARTPAQRNKIRERMVDEILDYASDLGVTEAKKQLRAGATPNTLDFDKGAVVTRLTPAQARAIIRIDPNTQRIKGFKRTYSFFYTDFEVLIKAVTIADARLRALIRNYTGDAAKSIYYWCEDSQRGGSRFTSVSQAVGWIRLAQAADATVHIMGPTVEYRRDVIYRHRGRKRKPTQWVSLANSVNEGPATDRYKFTGLVRSRIGAKKAKDRKFTSAVVTRRSRKGYQVQVGKAIGMVVVQYIRRAFKDLYASYRFVPSHQSEMPLDVMGHHKSKWEPRTPGSNKHIPRIALGLRSLSNRRIKTAVTLN